MSKLEDNIIYVLENLKHGGLAAHEAYPPGVVVEELHYKKVGLSTNRMWQVSITLVNWVSMEILQVLVGDARYTRCEALRSLRDKVRYLIANQIVDGGTDHEEVKRLLKLLDD
jgi:hypothetical protein